MADPEEPKPDAEDAERAGTAREGASEKPVKKKAKAKADAGEGTSAIRDRNQRIREEAAAKRRAKRDQETSKRPTRNLDAGEVVDDALARSTHAIGGFLKRYFNVVQWLVVVGLVIWIGWEIYAWRGRRSVEKSSDELAKAISAETGIVGPPPPAEPGMADPRRVFATDEERIKAATKEYQALLASGKSGAAALGQLALAGVLYDAGKFKDAKAAYETVKGSDVAGRDRDVKGRALEGLGMSLEAQGQKDAALKAFRELENTDTLGFPALGLYHQARVLHGQGNNDKAKENLLKADKKLKDAKNVSVTGYQSLAIRELMQLIDPAAVASLTSGMPSELMDKLKVEGGAGSKEIDAAKLEELIREMGKRVGSGSAAPPVPQAPLAPGPLAPTPEAPTPEAPAPPPASAP